MMLVCVMVLAPVMVLACVVVLAHVMVLASVVVLAHVTVLSYVMSTLRWSHSLNLFFYHSYLSVSPLAMLIMVPFKRNFIFR